ncbi:MAG: NUDIX domain-containing protein [Lachnospiraceae bacterium]|nr:NUDIX domain-containing protein [Lachnospiraceae bacterium]
MFQWNDDTVRLFRRAADRTHYYDGIVAKMMPHLTPDMHICDAGCGCGYLSLALAPYVKQVTAIDRHAGPLEVLADNCRKKNITNIDIRCEDIFSLQSEAPLFDAMVFCFFGSTEETVLLSRKLCRGPVFSIKHDYPYHRFSVNEKRIWDGCLGTERYLDNHHIAYEGLRLSEEFGQPLTSLEEGRLFFESYSHDKDKSIITDDFVLKAVEKTEDPLYPYYVPGRRDLGLTIWQAQELGDSGIDSFGAVVFEQGYVLMVKTRKGWSFPKGHAEPRELPGETAIREVMEETGIRITVDTHRGFVVPSILPEDRRTVTFFPGKSLDGLKIPVADEVPDARWVKVDEAADLIVFDSDRNMYLELRQVMGG